MAGTLRLSNTGTGNGQSTITTAASGDTTYTLPSGGGTFVTTASTQALTVPFASGTVSAPSVTFLGDTNTGIYSPAADTIAFTEGGVEALRIDSSGRVGIGTTSPGKNLDIEASDPRIRLSSNASNNATVELLSNAKTSFIYSQNSGNLNLQANNELILLVSAGTERARIDSSGRLLVGTSSARTGIYAGVSPVQINDNGSARNLDLIGTANSPYGPEMLFIKARSGTNIVQNGDYLADIKFIGYDGAADRIGATISAIIDGTPGAGDMPGRLVFSTTADGASSPTERMRIGSNGLILGNNSSIFATGRLATTTFANAVVNLYLYAGSQPSGTGNYNFYQSIGQGVYAVAAFGGPEYSSVGPGWAVGYAVFSVDFDNVVTIISSNIRNSGDAGMSASFTASSNYLVWSTQNQGYQNYPILFFNRIGANL